MVCLWKQCKVWSSWVVGKWAFSTAIGAGKGVLRQNQGSARVERWSRAREGCRGPERLLQPSGWGILENLSHLISSKSLHLSWDWEPCPWLCQFPISCTLGWEENLCQRSVSQTHFTTNDQEWARWGIKHIRNLGRAITSLRSNIIWPQEPCPRDRIYPHFSSLSGKYRQSCSPYQQRAASWSQCKWSLNKPLCPYTNEIIKGPCLPCQTLFTYPLVY